MTAPICRIAAPPLRSWGGSCGVGCFVPRREPAGKPRWRAVNERLLRDGWEAFGLVVGREGGATSASVLPSVEFINRPTARNWYRAHNVSVVSAYLEHRDLAETESRTERFFMNLVLMRVLYAHALVASPRLALGWLAPLAPLLGDPRLEMTGIFLSISRILPDQIPWGRMSNATLRANTPSVAWWTSE